MTAHHEATPAGGNPGRPARHKRRLNQAIDAYNQAERAEFIRGTGLTWLGTDGPVYVIGRTRVRALFVGPDGRHWADAALYAESLDLQGAPRNATAACLDGVSCADDSRDLWVCTDTRGRWNGLIAPVDVIAREFFEPAPFQLPGANWARTWWDITTRSDEMELAWIARGGTPTNAYLIGDQP